MKYIIFIGGYKGHGKNYISNLFANKTNIHEILSKYDIESSTSSSKHISDFINIITQTNYNYYNVAFADLLKQQFISENNISLQFLEQNKEMFRKGLQQYSTKHLSIDPNYYTEFLYSKIKLLLDSYQINNHKENIIICITDYRKPSEFDFFQKHIHDTDVVLLKIKVIDTHKNIDYNDEWEQKLHDEIYDLHFIRKNNS